MGLKSVLLDEEDMKCLISGGILTIIKGGEKLTLIWKMSEIGFNSLQSMQIGMPTDRKKVILNSVTFISEEDS